MELFTLRELCERVGVTRRVIQGYEARKLICSFGKNKYGHLLYDDKEIKRARLIKFLQNIGYSLSEIKMIIDLSDDELKGNIAEKINCLKQEIVRINLLIETAKKLIQEDRIIR